MSARQAFAAYPYLFTNVLALAGVLVAGWFARPAERRLLVRLGGLMLLTFPCAAIFEGDYWRPVRIAPWPLGIEDVLCAFNLGATGFLPALWLFGRRLRIPDSLPFRGRRVVPIGLAAAFGMLLLWSITGSPHGALILVQAAGFGLLLLTRPDLWRLGLVNGVGFTVMYGCELILFFWLWPGLGAYWHPHPVWARPVLGIPLVELAFAATYGAAWGVFAGYVFDLRETVHATTGVWPNDMRFRRASARAKWILPPPGSLSKQAIDDTPRQQQRPDDNR